MKGPIIHIAASMTVWPREALEVRTVCGVQGMLIGTWRQHEVNEARNALGQVLLTNIFESNLNMPTCLACVELFNQQPRNPWDKSNGKQKIRA